MQIETNYQKELFLNEESLVFCVLFSLETIFIEKIVKSIEIFCFLFHINFTQIT